MSQADIVCPNCSNVADGGLYISETDVTHCGCYHEADPKKVRHHAVNAEPLIPCAICGVDATRGYDSRSDHYVDTPAVCVVCRARGYRIDCGDIVLKREPKLLQTNEEWEFVRALSRALRSLGSQLS